MSLQKRNRFDIDSALGKVLLETDTLTADVTATDKIGTQFSYLSTNAIVKILRKHFKTNLKIERSFALDGDIFTYNAAVSLYLAHSKEFIELSNGFYQIPADIIKDASCSIFELSPAVYSSEAALSIALNSLGVVPNNQKTIPLLIEAKVKPELKSQEDGRIETSKPEVTSEREAPTKPEVASEKEAPTKPEVASEKEAPTKPEVASEREAPTKPEPAYADIESIASEVEGFPPYSEGKNGLSKLAYTRRCQELKELGITEEVALMSFLERSRPNSLLDMSPAQATGLKNKINDKDSSYWKGLEDKLKARGKPHQRKKVKPSTTESSKGKAIKFDLNALKPLDRTLVDNEVMRARRNLKMNFRLADAKVKGKILEGIGLPKTLTNEEIYSYISTLTKDELKDMIAKFS